MRRALLAIGVMAGCIGPQVSDEPGPSGDIVPAGTVVPSIDEEAGDAAQIAANDGVDGVVPRLTAFAAGAPTHVWDFGPAPPFAAPIFVVMRRQGGGLVRVAEHPGIVGVIPGDHGYSPFWAVFAVVATDGYHGELLTSATAIEEAVRDGLVEAPVAQATGLDCPIVARDVRLDVGDGEPITPTAQLYYEHHAVPCFDLGPIAIGAQLDVAPAPRYVLRREGGEPLSEPLRHVDLDGDGDLVDSNDVYARAADDPARSPACRRVDVAVVASTASIDTSGNDSQAQVTSAEQLFAPGPVAGMVVSYQASDEIRHCPAQRTGGP